ncbi:uncharacterized protein LOC131161861 [Malania oleifera]|uniref:uncharacterized protein LOC131161861 n=1 Tax=Malania oleifera TaxID=397392 RepID=UPI0025AE58BA|nr:uncharacterized protein LOC131161861 [Malania oleifera]
MGDHVFLRVAPLRGAMRFEKKGKPSPRFIGPFKILERVGPAAYRLALLSVLSKIHDMFHVSMLRKYVQDLSHVVSYEEVKLKDTLSYDETPVQILDKKEQESRTKKIPLVEVLWRNRAKEKTSLELEEEIRQKYPHLFSGDQH